MLSIFRKHALGFLSHIMTFSLMGAMHIVRGQPPLFFSMVLMLPLWATSSILWSEKDESEEFLRTLPLTGRELARAKFTLALSAMAVYWLVLTTVLTLVAGGTAVFAPGFALMNTIWSVSLILMALWYAGIWFFGVKPMLPIMLLFMGLNLLVAISFLTAVRRMEGAGIASVPLLRVFLGAPWYVGPVVAAVAIAAYYGLMRVAERARALAASM